MYGSAGLWGFILAALAGTAAALAHGVDAERSAAAAPDDPDARSEEVARYWLGSDRSLAAKSGATAPALAMAIRLGRAEARRAGVRPLPRELKAALARHYPRDVLHRARWMVADPQSRLGQMLGYWQAPHGAVTLGEVIVFKSQRATGNERLLAHELVHVAQYRKLGIDRFARRYAANPAAIEEEARVKAEQVIRSVQWDQPG
jgi:hypothetical protein